MSKEQVTSFADLGPYKSFRNGDLETYNGEFDHQKRNVQFFFNVSGLNRIEVNMYEGGDLKQATEAFQSTYTILNRDYGDLTANGFELPIPRDALRVALAAATKVQEGNKVQIAPIIQDAELHVSSTFRQNEVAGYLFYFVVIYLDPPNRRDMPMVPPLLAKPPGN